MIPNKVQHGCSSGWHKGPLPAETWNWGGVVPVGSDPHVGFYFADFQGDHVLIQKSINGLCVWVRIQPEEVAYFNNCLSMPLVG